MTSPIPLEAEIQKIRDTFEDELHKHLTLTGLKKAQIKHDLAIVALIQTVCESVVGLDDWTEEDFDLESEDDIVLDQHRIKVNKAKNSLRASQRQTLKDIISGKVKL